MEIVIMIIMAMVSFSFLLKLSYHGWVGRCIFALVTATFVIACYDAAASQSKTQIADWLTQADLMLDVSVLLTVDVAIQICWCILMAKSGTSGMSRTEKVMLRICSWFPGILIFPTLFAILTELIFTFTGADFATIAWSFSGALLIIIPLLAALVKYLIPEDDIRMELNFMVNLIIAALGVVATVNGRTAAAGTSEVDWTALTAVLIIILLGLVSGVIMYRFLLKKKITKIQYNERNF